MFIIGKKCKDERRRQVARKGKERNTLAIWVAFSAQFGSFKIHIIESLSIGSVEWIALH